MPQRKIRKYNSKKSYKVKNTKRKQSKKKQINKRIKKGGLSSKYTPNSFANFYNVDNDINNNESMQYENQLYDNYNQIGFM